MNHDPSEGVFAVVLTHYLKPGAAARFLELLHPVLDQMRREPSFINAVLHQNQEAADIYHLYETWEDRTDYVKVQLMQPYRDAFEKTLPELLLRPRQMQIWRPLRADFTFFS